MVSTRMTKHRKIAVGFIFGVVFAILPLVGLFGSDLVIHRAYVALGPSGINDPHRLSCIWHISVFLAGVCFALGPIGLVIFVISLVVLLRSRRAESSLRGNTAI
jgi:hypothetical protein